MKSKQIFVVVSCFFLSLLACDGDSDSLGNKEIENRLSLKLPAYWEVTSFEVQAKENIGTKVEPLIKARFKAEVSLESDTYIYDKKINGVTFISVAARRGEKREIYGISTAKIFRGNWQVDFEFENDPMSELGKPRDFYIGKNFILKGSAEEDSLMAAIQKKQEEEGLRKETADRERLLSKKETRQFSVVNKFRYKNELSETVGVYIRTSTGLSDLPSPFYPTGGKWDTISVASPRDFLVTLPKRDFDNKKFVIESIK